jgi:23S rRNA (adenine2503-C2)-methyltransferase
VAEKKKELLGLTLEELQEVTSHLNLPRFAAREIALWIYRRNAGSFDEMTNISKSGRELLKQYFTIGLTPFIRENISEDGTKKYVFPAGENRFIETAYIPDKKRHTLCVSSQIGCKYGCSFCMTGKQGFQGQLDVSGILNQILSIPEREQITNLVFMGMGEPFDNTDVVMKALKIITADYGMAISSKKVTVSTVGLIPGMKRFLEESRCNLAISLHSPFDDEREKLMPVQKKYPLTEIIRTLKDHPMDKYRRLSFEYILLKGLNDTQHHVNQLARLLNGLRFRINLIRFHNIPDSPYKSPGENAVHNFRDRLDAKKITATVRASRGEDILAACGLLSTKELNEQKNDGALNKL